jgi:hypothetical protein
MRLKDSQQCQLYAMKVTFSNGNLTLFSSINRGRVVENQRTVNIIRILRCWLKAGSNHYRMSGQNKDEADVQVKGSLMEDVHTHTSHTHLTTHGSDI